MFRQIVLKNFRQHRDLNLDLAEGVVAIRGANEAGKTTVIEAIAYALFGATALREPLSETVTWGEKESTLKVRVDFNLNGVDYRITRSKSGAEIRTEDKIEATGQSEVVRFVETLLGASKDVCRNLMMADQAALRGALAKGPSAAIELIEKLANFSLIDTIIGLVQDQLPCGTTSAVEARVATLDAQVGQPVQDDTGPLVTAVEEREQAVNELLEQYQGVKAIYDAVQEPARDAEKRLQAHRDAVAARSGAQQRYDQSKAAYERINPVPGLTDPEMETLRKAAEAAQTVVVARAARAELEALPEPDNEWEGDYDSLVQEKAQTEAKVTALTAEIEKHKRDHAVAGASIITQTACGLCGKDLSAIPEVAQKNDTLNAQMVEIEGKVKKLEEERAEQREMVAALAGIMTASANRQRTTQRHHQFITLDHGYVPARWTWTGPDTDAAVDSIAAARRWREAEDVRVRYQQTLGQQTQARAAMDQAGQALAAAVGELGRAEAAAEGQQAILDDAATKTVRLNDIQGLCREAQEALRTARQALEAGQAVLRERQRAREALTEALAAAKAELAEMQDNNALIQCIRKARPEITDELWDIASASISKHFSDIRGVESEVTRSDNGFKVDGQSIGGLSGSTLDALGLAIRVALTKVFLPNTAFALLDEPAAAADDERESNMLGLIATSGFAQVLVITHSDLIDSFASQVIRL